MRKSLRVLLIILSATPAFSDGPIQTYLDIPQGFKVTKVLWKTPIESGLGLSIADALANTTTYQIALNGTHAGDESYVFTKFDDARRVDRDATRIVAKALKGCLQFQEALERQWCVTSMTREALQMLFVVANWGPAGTLIFGNIETSNANAKTRSSL